MNEKEKYILCKRVYHIKNKKYVKHRKCWLYAAFLINIYDKVTVFIAFSSLKCTVFCTVFILTSQQSI